MKMYLISALHPCRKIKEVDVEVLSPNGDRKWTWAIHRGRRHLVGSSAFYTLPAAWRSKVGYLTKIIETKALWYIQPELCNKAKEILKRGIIE